jgi:hypothetical protein
MEVWMTGLRHLLFASITILFLSSIGCESVKIYGPIESRPEGKEGTWIIAGRTFTVTDTTKLDEDNGPLVVGACAQVELKGIVVEEIESEEASKCRQYEAEKIYGTIESRPEGKAGTWKIGGRSYEMKDTTKIDEDDGPLVVGACAEVELIGNVVKEIESEKKSKCSK